MIEIKGSTKNARLIYKPHSVQRRSRVLPLRWPSLWDARYRATLAAYPELEGIEQIPACTRHASPLLGLAPDGGYLAAVSPRTPVVSYTTFSPLLRFREAVYFLWPFSGKLPRPGCYPASCSQECGLSSVRSRRTAVIWLTWQYNHNLNLAVRKGKKFVRNSLRLIYLIYQ